MKDAFEKAKRWLQSKTARASVALSVALVGLAGMACAADEGSSEAVDTVVTAVTNGVQSFAGKAASLIGVMIVSAIPIAGALWLARRAFSWFKGMAK